MAIKELIAFYLILMILIIIPAKLYSQDEYIKFETLSGEQGLSQNSVICILQDSKGFMWFGTTDGFNKYDAYDFTTYGNGLFVRELYEDSKGYIWVGTLGEGLFRFDRRTETLTNYKHSPSDKNSLSHNDVRSIVEDDRGYLWIGTFGGGLNRFNPATNSFKHYKNEKYNPNSLSSNSIRGVVEDKNNILWIATYGGGLNKFDIESETFKHYRHNPNNPQSIATNSIITVYIDSNDIIWMGLLYNGLGRFDPEKESFKYYRHNPDDDTSISSDKVQCIYEDDSNTLWVGTFGKGLNRFDRKNERFYHYRYSEQDPKGISDDYILSIYQDNSGLMWIGTNWKGIAKFRKKNKFTHYKKIPSNPNSLSDNPVWSIYEDKQGILWIGTASGGLNRFDRSEGKFTSYNNDPDDPDNTGHLDIRKIYEDSKGNLWIGTQYKGLNKFDRETKTFTHIPYYKNIPVNDNYTFVDVREIYEDSEGILWIGTFRKGLNKFDRETEEFTPYMNDPSIPHSISNDNIRAIYEDKEGILWIGTYGGGLNKFNKKNGTFKSYQHNENKLYSISKNKISSIYEDNEGILWIGTYGGGLNRFDKNSEKFTPYSVEDGLPSEVVYGVLGDSEGNLWLSHNKGLSKFNPQTEKFRNYNTSDGVQSNEFNSGAYHKSSSGEMFFGGINGFNAFYPEKIKDSLFNPSIVLTSFKKFDNEVKTGKALSEIKNIKLDWYDNFFAFEFSSLDYTSPEKNLYRYILEGFNESWIESGTRRYISYTNLNGGSYTLKVQGTNSDGVWGEDILNIDIEIETVPWQTWWAYSIYLLVGAVILFSSVFLIRRRFKLNEEKLEQERRISDRLRQIDKLKDDFLANTSHELRTPIVGIIGIAESLKDGIGGELSKEVQRNLSLIIASGKRLSSLVNDILDYSKMKREDIELNIKTLDIRQIVEVVITLSRPLLRNKNLRLINNIPKDFPFIKGDEDRLQQIMHNLISNAIKFTRAGKIEVNAEKQGDSILISVSDTGIGIEEDKQDDIFKSFEQIDASIEREYSGTGLGLSITKRLIELHGGNIWLKSTPNIGSTFYFTLPISKEKPKSIKESKIKEVITLEQEYEQEEEPKPEPFIYKHTKGKATILIVDDEPVNLQVLTNYLSIENYGVISVNKGEKALEVIESGKEKPDLVLLDVMMPKLSGLEVCTAIRKKYKLTELPVIMLTAKNRPQDFVAGFEVGANDYIPKPFDKKELLNRIKVHLELSRTQNELKKLNKELEQKVYERTSQLQLSNEELEQANEELEQTNEELEATLNQLKETQNNMIMQEKMASLGSLTAGIAHEIKNPLNFINNFAKLSYDITKSADELVNNRKEELNTKDYEQLKSYIERLNKIVSRICEHGDRANNIVHSMLLHFHGGKEEKFRININNIVREYSKLAYHGIKTNYSDIMIDIEYNFDDNIEPVKLVPSEMGRVILNITNNACYEVFEKKKKSANPYYKPEINIKTTDTNDYIEIELADNGNGISDNIIDKIYEPFFTTKPPGVGTGLGLSISYDIIVNRYKGEIRIETRKEDGTKVIISLPKQS